MCAQDWHIPYLNRLLAKLPAFPYPLHPGLSPTLYHLAYCTVPVSSTTPDPTQATSKVKHPNRESPLLSVTDQILKADHLLLLGDAGTGKSTILNLLCARLCLTALASLQLEAGLNIQADLAEKLHIKSDEPLYALSDLLPIRLSTQEWLARQHSSPATRLKPLTETISSQLESFGLADLTQPVLEMLKDQGGMFILDDLELLNQFPSSSEQVGSLLDQFEAQYPRCRVILACQTRPEQIAFAPPAGYQTVHLAPLDADHITLFLDSWFKPGWLSTSLSAKEFKQRKNKLAAELAEKSYLGQLASNPAHLSMLCALATWQAGPLPACRELLQIRTCQLLMEQPGRSIERSQPLAKIQPQTNYLEARQAYRHSSPASLLERWQAMPGHDDEQVRLVAVMAYLDKPSRGWDWVERLCLLEDGSSLAPTAAHLAGNLAARVFPRLGSTLPPSLLPTLQRALLFVLQKASLPARARAESGDDLAFLGDPRFDPQNWYLPSEPLLGFVQIPAGSFKMGTDAKDVPAMLKQWGFGPDWVGQAQPIKIMQQWYQREIPQHDQHLERYYIARYPCTVAQFRTFCQVTGYQPAYPECLERPANHPVWNVNFGDALAYCRWLDQMLKTSPQLPPMLGRSFSEGWHVTIPSEAEWEKAARGESVPPRLYPWGNEFDADKANLSETGLGKPCSVGCFPRGASPYGLLDLCGNVWEWTRSCWGKDPNQPEFGYPYLAGDGREQIVEDETLELRTLRGASCNNYQRYARCATRRAPIPVYRSSLRGFRLALVKP